LCLVIIRYEVEIAGFFRALELRQWFAECRSSSRRFSPLLLPSSRSVQISSPRTLRCATHSGAYYIQSHGPSFGPSTVSFGSCYLASGIAGQRDPTSDCGVDGSTGRYSLRPDRPQLPFAFDLPGRFLIRDNDKIYGMKFRNRVNGLGLEQIRTAFRSP
jgi:hypothetical protein